MSLLIRRTKFQILIFSFILTLIIFTLNKKSDSNLLNKFPFNLRNLISSDDVDKRCKKTEKNFLEKYKETYVSNIRDEDLTEYQKALQEIVINKNIKKIKDYLLRIVVYLGLLVLDAFLIITWCGLCGCICCYKNKSYATGCSKCLFSFYIFLTIITILICVYGYFIIPCLYKSLNSFFCSFYKIVFHFIEGTKIDFPNNNWKGVKGIKNLINKYEDTNDIFKKLPKLEDMISDCAGEANHFCTKYEEFKSSIKESENDEFMVELSEAEQYINNISSFFIKIKDEKLEDLEKYLEYFDKYYKIGLSGLFCAILIFCLFELLILIVYFICKCNCISCLFHLFWNIEMIIIIATLFIGIIFGILGVLSKDIISILKYAKSSKNLKNETSIILDIDENFKEPIDICFNGNGDLSKFAFESDKIFDESNNETFHKFEEFYFQNKDNYIVKNKEKLSDAYKSLYQVLKNLKELYDDLNEEYLNQIFNCEFIKYDFDILIDELNKSLSKKLTLFSLIIILADVFAVLSLMFGVIIVTKYKGQNESEKPKNHLKYKKSKRSNSNMDTSSDNLRK